MRNACNATCRSDSLGKSYLAVHISPHSFIPHLAHDEGIEEHRQRELPVIVHLSDG